MDETQPNQTLLNIADDLEELAVRASGRMRQQQPDHPTLSEELYAIHDSLEDAVRRLRALQEHYPDQFR